VAVKVNQAGRVRPALKSLLSALSPTLKKKSLSLALRKAKHTCHGAQRIRISTPSLFACRKKLY